MCTRWTRSAEQLLEPCPQLLLVGVGVVEHDHLLAVRAEHPGMVADEDREQQRRHQRGRQPRRVDREAAEQPERESDEEVGDLALLHLGGAEADDRQHAEQAESESGADLGRRQRLRHGEHGDVDAEEGDHQVAPPVPGEVQAEHEHHHGGDVGGEEGGEWHGDSRVVGSGAGVAPVNIG